MFRHCAARLSRCTRWEAPLCRPFHAGMPRRSSDEAAVQSLFLSFAAQEPGRSAALEEVFLDRDAFKRMLSSLGVCTSEETLEKMLKRADLNNDGHICYTEFREAHKWLLSQEQTEADLRAVFNMLDQDKNGFIEPDELMSLTTTTKMGITKLDTQEIIAAAGGDYRKGMTFDQFATLMKDNKILGWKLLTTFRVIFVTGGPGSGKGTVCTRVVKETNSLHVSSGDLLRQEVESKTPLGLQVSEVMKAGKLVDASVVLALLEKFLMSTPGKFVFLDGFPRSEQNARDFHAMFGPGECMLLFQCPDEEMVRRIVERGKSSGRADDNEQVAWARVRTFHEQSRGPIQYFRRSGVPIYEVDSTRPIDENVQRILALPMFRKN